MSARRDGRPDRSGVLFEYLFGRTPGETFERLSSGVESILDNAEALLDDASILVNAKRYERAEFLIATAQEEVGKAYILLDMCRLDFRRQDMLRRLCGNFYNHVIKHVYFDYSANQYPGIRTLLELRHYFCVSATEWWLSGPESGEPDMPNNVFFLREANLYVDVDSYAGKWMVPRLPSKSLMFEGVFLGSPLDEAMKALAKLRNTQAINLFQPNALQVFNQAMKPLIVSENTTMNELRVAYDRVSKALEASCGVSSDVFIGSELHNWPMYWIKR